MMLINSAGMGLDDERGGKSTAGMVGVLTENFAGAM